MLNTTIQNRSKHPRLSSDHVVPTHHLDTPEVAKFLESLDVGNVDKERLLFSIGNQLLTDRRNPAVRDFLVEYQCEVMDVSGIPTQAFDVLGSVYQYLNSKAENLERGTFYTGKEIALDILDDLGFNSGETLFDPACGSGSFLFHSDAPADKIFGVDFDPIAIMIAKFNYFIKFPTAPAPNLYCADFFVWYSSNSHLRFDYIIGNPPYGANLDRSLIPSLHISSGESFSYFMELGFNLLKEGGLLRYLVPESLLNVKRHQDIRIFLLDHTNLLRIKRYQSKFAGVMSDVYLVEVDRNTSEVMTFVDEEKICVPKSIFRELKNQIFTNLSQQDITIIQKVNAIRKCDLSASTFGLGVVTGDNKSKLFAVPDKHAEPIYTGKEVQKYSLLPPRNYIIFDRQNLQQVAPEEIYRAPEKLVYKTISKQLKVAMDTTGALTSNSANLFIPDMPGYDVITVMAFLNSRLYSYLNIKLFGGVNKVAKENLMALPFPELSDKQNDYIAERAAEAQISGDDDVLQKFICVELFGLSQTEINYIDLLVNSTSQRQTKAQRKDRQTTLTPF